MKTDHPAGRIHRRRRHLHHRVEVPTFVQPRGPRVVEVRNVDDNESDVNDGDVSASAAAEEGALSLPAMMTESPIATSMSLASSFWCSILCRR